MATAGDVGERRLIEIMIQQFTPMPEMPIPFWDDAMAVSLGEGRAAVLNTDMLVWETDVPRGMTPYQAARKAVVMNFSDLGAKGVQPLAFLSSIGIPRDLEIDIVEEMALGFEEGAREYGGYVIGGDTNEASEIIISGIAFGIAFTKKIIKRENAKPGDILAATGPFGNTSAAFKILLEGFDAPEGLRETLVESIYKPEARVKEGICLAKTRAVTSSIDSSDGLAISLYDLARSSGVGFKIDSLPVSPESETFAELHALDPLELVLYGGEEYELVFTVDPRGLKKVRAALENIGCELYVLGVATDNEKIHIKLNGIEQQVENRGWEHFLEA